MLSIIVPAYNEQYLVERNILLIKMEFDKIKHDKIKKHLKDYYSKKGFEIRETGNIKGGLKIITGKNSFVWFRASKTEGNVFRIVSESDGKKEAEKLMEEAIDVFNKANE